MNDELHKLVELRDILISARERLARRQVAYQVPPGWDRAGVIRADDDHIDLGGTITCRLLTVSGRINGIIDQLEGRAA